MLQSLIKLTMCFRLSVCVFVCVYVCVFVCVRHCNIKQGSEFSSAHTRRGASPVVHTMYTAPRERSSYPSMAGFQLHNQVCIHESTIRSVTLVYQNLLHMRFQNSNSDLTRFIYAVLFIAAYRQTSPPIFRGYQCWGCRQTASPPFLPLLENSRFDEFVVSCTPLSHPHLSTVHPPSSPIHALPPSAHSATLTPLSLTLSSFFHAWIFLPSVHSIHWTGSQGIDIILQPTGYLPTCCNGD